MKKSIELFNFPSNSWNFERGDESIKLWSNDDGDTASLNYFDLAPNLPTALKIEHIDLLRNHYRQLIASQSGGIVSVELVEQAGLKGIELIIKAPQKPFGMTYIASITFPFYDLSFVIKYTCQEFGTTGFRDSAIGSKLSENLTKHEKSDFKWWKKDPYDSMYDEIALYNLSDHEVYDSDFITHPLSRARNHLIEIKNKISFDPALVDYPKFKSI